MENLITPKEPSFVGLWWEIKFEVELFSLKKINKNPVIIVKINMGTKKHPE